MKHFAFLAIICSWFNTSAQVTLENSYTGNHRMYLDKIEDDGYKYVGINDATKKVLIYNIDHSLWKTIDANIPVNATIIYTLPFYVSKKLFNSDNKIELLVTYNDGTNYIAKIVNEDGIVLNTFTDIFAHNIKNTDNGWKLLLHHILVPQQTDVYSLPGEYVGLHKINEGKLESDFYPNPLNESAIINYQLQSGVKSGVVNVYNNNGALMRMYNIDTPKGHVVFQRGDLPSGVYYYNITTINGVGATDKFIIQ